VIVLGVILLLIGLVAKIAILWTIGLVLIVIGASRGSWVRWVGLSAAGATTGRPSHVLL
jgi:hypothetical protein